eukprot:6213758-Pleurochrysis_carterae.AAC.2
MHVDMHKGGSLRACGRSDTRSCVHMSACSIAHECMHLGIFGHRENDADARARRLHLFEIIHENAEDSSARQSIIFRFGALGPDFFLIQTARLRHSFSVKPDRMWCLDGPFQKSAREVSRWRLARTWQTSDKRKVDTADQ